MPLLIFLLHTLQQWLTMGRITPKNSLPLGDLDPI